jgi:hypothetical protein
MGKSPTTGKRNHFLIAGFTMKKWRAENPNDIWIQNQNPSFGFQAYVSRDTVGEFHYNIL